ncbi:transcriptional coactivator PipX [Leptolyngbya sp. FACHB-261]|uniref:transcriptional coactivator PipX n=1 Tax=Leptolyngbya sp. FACHB-261 TaxID=2692806 RepID=UPI00168581EB|nr:PipX family protein [Leptolyngbya sp. FACHB-261]MBD2101084.1 PipX family protein [Leptolyngbya sp. FACHB-261]
MSPENYLNHPTFGLLSSVCILEENRQLFTTLYAQRLFFLVTTSPDGLEFEPLGRVEARLLMENHLRRLRRNGQQNEYAKLQDTYKRTFP